jgi:ankyrin repeat protein
MSILEAVKRGDVAEVHALLDEPVDLNALDADGWTPLNWAAGRGDLEMVKLLVAKGADVLARGRDKRTPYLVALAAGHRDTVVFLQEAEEARGGDLSRTSSRQHERRAYCRAYPIGALRAFGGWTEAPRAETAHTSAGETASSAGAELADDAIVFLHQDYSVTESVVAGTHVVFAGATPEWRAFCQAQLAFDVPTDLDLLVANA